MAILKKNPIWLVPKSIQEEMAREGEIVKSKVPPGPDNPLGEYWIGLDAAGYGIHGTIAPASVYHFQSHGCIRLHHDDIEQLFPRVSEGLIVELIYVPVLMVEENGHVFVEINPDIYGKALPPLDVVHQLAEEKRVADRIDWQRVHELILRQDGIASGVNLDEAIGEQGSEGCRTFMLEPTCINAECGSV
ncbi:MAG: L,D-transpeptidase [Gammaproteobacteria bacterium]|nr:L,D-transpeptidase [Gammaproteobacteria bacterium]